MNQDTTYQVKNIDLDLYKYYEHTFLFRYIDYRVTHEYVDKRRMNIHIQLLNSNVQYSADSLNLLLCYREQQDSQIISIPKFHGNHYKMEYQTDYDIEPDEDSVFHLLELHPPKLWKTNFQIRKIVRKRFNAMFNTDIVILPKSMFAIGIADWGAIYMYHEDVREESRIDIAGGYPIEDSVEWQNIREPVFHLLRVLCEDLENTPPKLGYFIVASTDGYLERTYWSANRTVPRKIGELECVGMTLPPLDLKDTEYPVFHHRHTIFTQSGHVGLPYTINIPDRHYFFHNLNHSFRSFHMGLPWEMKEAKIVYAGQDRDNKYNFISPKARKMGVAPREYFKSMVSPENRDIIECDGSWIDRQNMIYFKYILDIDGTAATWDATAWKLNSGSVIFKPQSGWKQWFYDSYLPNVHYIEIKDDFSDIREKFEWCQSHPIECMEMIDRCKALFQQVYSYKNIIEHTKKVIIPAIYQEVPKAAPIDAPLTPTTLAKKMAATSASTSASPQTSPQSLLSKKLEERKRNSIYNYIDQVFYINLDRRKDRRNHIESTFQKYGIDKYERFSAIPHDFGIVGCTKSHQAVYKLAKERGYKNVLIFEDDFEFLVTPDEFHQTVQQMFSGDAGFDGDVCMFSYNLTHKDDTDCSYKIRILEASTASCYMVMQHYYDRLIDLYEVAIPLLESTREHWKYANDQCWKVLQIEDRWYGSAKRMGKQLDGYSDNSKEFVKNIC